MKPTAEQLRRLLPTLQHLARFPTCNWEAIARRDGVAVPDVQAFILAEAGNLSLWDEDALAEAAKRLGVKLAPYKPGLPRSAPAAAASAKPAATKTVAPAAPSTPPAARPAPAAAPVRSGKRSKPEYFEVARRLLADATLSENQAAKDVGVRSSSWCYFKKIHLGIGPIDRSRLQALVAGGTQSLPPLDGDGRDKLPIVKAEAPARSKAERPRLPANALPTLASPEPSADVLAQINARISDLHFQAEVLAVRLLPVVNGKARA